MNNEYFRHFTYQKLSADLNDCLIGSAYSPPAPIKAKKIDESEVSDHPNLKIEKRPQRVFVTGSSYTGEWDCLNMCGVGVYEMFNGVTYEGEFQDGRFHGSGILYYPNGSRIEGHWTRGHLIRSKYFFSDGTKYIPIE